MIRIQIAVFSGMNFRPAKTPNVEQNYLYVIDDYELTREVSIDKHLEE